MLSIHPFLELAISTGAKNTRFTTQFAPRFSLLVAALGHDIGHPGVNNGRGSRCVASTLDALMRPMEGESVASASGLLFRFCFPGEYMFARETLRVSPGPSWKEHELQKTKPKLAKGHPKMSEIGPKASRRCFRLAEKDLS